MENLTEMLKGSLEGWRLGNISRHENLWLRDLPAA